MAMESMSIESIDLANLPDQLRRKLDQRSPEPTSHREFAPQYAFGRHRGPAPRFAHRAAVMIALVPGRSGEWSIPLTLRPSQMSDHGGQVSLPGGRAEPSESHWRTGCREFGEELGCTTEYLQPLGELTPIYVFASRHLVTPNVGVCGLRPAMNPNPEEVAQLIHLSVAELISDTITTVGTLRRGTAEFDAPGFRIGDHFVWGATAMILAEFRQLVLEIQTENQFEPWLM
jgi:8-oxo-dGTP pyrophosphatase MutT (NUDIX family)